jgi:hypothetical protein
MWIGSAVIIAGTVSVKKKRQNDAGAAHQGTRTPAVWRFCSAERAMSEGKKENLADSIGANLSNEGMNLGRRGKPGAELGLLSQEKLRLPENFTESCSNLRFYAQFALPNNRRNRSPGFC